MRAVVHAMAMPFTIEADGLATRESFERATAALHEDLMWADAVFSLWDDSSVVSRYSRGELTLDECPREVREVFETCEWFRDATGGGFDARRADGVVDPTGVVKAWAVARAVRQLERAGATDWMVGAAGDVLAAPAGRDRQLGIADPRTGGDPQGGPLVDAVILSGRMRALATSGGAHNADHIWDPATGEPARTVMQASVVGSDLVECDAWATALVAAGAPAVPRAVARGLHVLIIEKERPDGSLVAHSSEGWPSVDNGG